MFVNTHKAGQLGNSLVHAAHLIAAGIESGHAVANPSLVEYAQYFETTSRDLLCRYPPRPSRLPRWRWVRRALYRLLRMAVPLLRRVPLLGRRVRVVVWRDLETDYWLDTPAFAAIARGARLVLFEGWLFRTGALGSHADDVRRYFTPLPEHARRVESFVGGLRSRCDLLVGVHVRRGDYARHLGGRFYWDSDTYARLMRSALALFPDRRVLFLVCSNEALDASRFDGLPVTFGPGHLIEDMYAFARCDYLLGPPSTYTLWASFYGRVPLRHVQDPAEELALSSFEIRGV